MRRLFSITALLATLFLCTACFTTMALTAVVLSNITPGEKVTISGRTLEQVNPQAALLQTDNGETVCIVCAFNNYKDGMKVKSKFIRCGLYQYTSPDGSERYAPIFVRKKDFKTLWPIAADLNVNAKSDPQQAEVYI